LRRLDTDPGLIHFSVMDAGIPLPAELEKFWRTDDGLTAVQRADAYGIDLSLIEANLRISRAERLRQNDSILNEVEFLREALEKNRP